MIDFSFSVNSEEVEAINKKREGFLILRCFQAALFGQAVLKVNNRQELLQ